jgi:hypothetical protein
MVFPPASNGEEGKLTFFAEEVKFGPDRRVTLLRLRRPIFAPVKTAEGEAVELSRVDRQAELTVCGMPYLHVQVDPPAWWDWSPVQIVPASMIPPTPPPNVTR